MRRDRNEKRRETDKRERKREDWNFTAGEKEDEEKMRYQSGEKREDKIEYGRGNKSTIN